METPTSSSSPNETDGSTTPRQSRNGRNFDALVDIPPPPYNGHRHGLATETSSLLSYDSFYDSDRGSRPQIRHIPPSPEYTSDDDGGSVATARRLSSQSGRASGSSERSEGGWKDTELNEWLPCICVLTVMAVIVVSVAAAVIYMLVTQ